MNLLFVSFILRHKNIRIHLRQEFPERIDANMKNRDLEAQTRLGEEQEGGLRYLLQVTKHSNHVYNLEQEKKVLQRQHEVFVKLS